MERRELLIGMAAMAAAAAAQAAETKPQDHSHHHHGGSANKAVLDAAADCVKTGELCLDHCHDLLAQGDKSLGECAKSVSELLAVCSTLRSLAAQDSKYLRRYAAFAMDVCKSCEEECRKHEKKHVQCRDCAESCAACARECKKIAA